jgi:hypothetical protein
MKHSVDRTLHDDGLDRHAVGHCQHEWLNLLESEQRLGRLLDYAVIVPRMQRLYEWSAEELAESRLLELVRDGSDLRVAVRRTTRLALSAHAVRGSGA